MKTLLSLILILLTMSTSAQIGTYNGKAQIFVLKFWKCMEMIKKIESENPPDKIRLCRVQAENASSQIDYIKKKDPAYDAASLEAMITPYLEAAAAEVKLKNEKVRAAGNNADKEGDGIAGLFMGTTTTEVRTTGNTDEDIANHKLQIVAYNQKVEKLIAAGISGANQYETYIRNLSAPSTQQIKKLEEQISKADNKLGLIAYRDLVGIETYWSAAKKVFINVPETGQVQNLAAAALQRIGTEEAVAVKIRKNYEDKIRNKKMPAAEMVNAGLESEFRKVFNNSFKELTIIKINIIAREWTVIRNEVTGVILGRKHSAAIAVKTKEGNCALYYFHIGQPYTGSGYGLSAENARGFDGELLCDNIK
ncbi:MAG: hypothetical protein SGI96_06170 [Bacteroidota bacterium]|nr:hypothetical protein [Bacteroidota bacterium]